MTIMKCFRDSSQKDSVYVMMKYFEKYLSNKFGKCTVYKKGTRDYYLPLLNGFKGLKVYRLDQTCQ